MIKKIYAADKLKNVPARWVSTYGNGHYANFPDKLEIAEKLQALIWPFTKKQIDEITGHDSWTKHGCSECGEYHETLIRIGDEPDYDARWVDLCDTCLAKAAAL